MIEDWIVICEESQEVAKALRELGHNAYSCDLQKCSGGRPDWHIQGDAREVLGRRRWPNVIAHPPCTDIAVSGAKWFKQKIADGRQKVAIDFFMFIADYDCDKLSIENPVCIMSSVWRKPDQIIQPFYFGHPERKTTCLWLKGLPKLKPTKNVYSEMMALPKRERERVHFMPPSADRGKLRSKTFPGIAQAMALQWAGKV